MIELPEAPIIAQQMSEKLRGKRTASAGCGNTPHKFAFYSRSPEEYAKILGESASKKVKILMYGGTS